MTERSMMWDGIILGDCGPYGSAELMDILYRAILNGTDNRGVLVGWLDNLEVTGTSSPLTVRAGAAIVYGMFYETDAAVSVSVSTPSSGLSRYDRIVIRREWGTQTVRIARVVGTAAASPAVPALTQVANSIWEIPLATILVTDAGAITVTDTREWVTYSTDIPAGAITAGMYVSGAVTADKVPDRTRSDTRGAGQIEGNSANPPTWTAGASYNYWSFADAAFNRAWVQFLGPTGLVGTINVYLWSVPNVNGAGGGVENAQWDYSVYYGSPLDASGACGALTNATGTVNVDQQLRVNTTVYRDQLIAALPVIEGNLIVLRVSRDGAADSYNSAMRLLAVEMEYTADA